MSIIYLQTASGKSKGEGRLLDVSAELSRNLPFQLRLGLALLMSPINQQNKIKKNQTKTQQNSSPWTFQNNLKNRRVNIMEVVPEEAISTIKKAKRNNWVSRDTVIISKLNIRRYFFCPKLFMQHTLLGKNKGTLMMLLHVLHSLTSIRKVLKSLRPPVSCSTRRSAYSHPLPATSAAGSAGASIKYLNKVEFSQHDVNENSASAGLWIQLLPINLSFSYSGDLWHYHALQISTTCLAHDVSETRATL